MNDRAADARHDPLALDAEALARYLDAHVPGFEGPLTATRFGGGQSNPTYRIDAASGRYVLRRQPPGRLLSSAHAVDREFRVIGALHGGAVPVARPIHLCEDASVIGTLFYLMDFVDGRIFWNPALPDIDAADRIEYFDAMMRTLAALHTVDVDAVGLADYGRAGNYFDRQIARWAKQYRAAQTQEIAAMQALIERLPAHAPREDDRFALVHGDYRFDNVIFDPRRPRVAAVVDWELSTLGHPLADLAYFCMALRLPPGGVIPGLGGVDRAAERLPKEEDVIAMYVAHGGRDPDRAHWRFALAFNFFRLAAIAQGVLARARQGNASSARAAEAGAMAPVLAGLGLQVLDGG